MSALRYTLVVRNPEGVAVALVAGSEVPEWASGLVHSDDLEPEVNPKPVEEPKLVEEPKPVEEPKRRTATK